MFFHAFVQRFLQNSLGKSAISGARRKGCFSLRNIALLDIFDHFGYFYLMFFKILCRRLLLFSLSKIIDFAAPTLENSLSKSATLAVPDAKSASKIKGKP